MADVEIHPHPSQRGVHRVTSSILVRQSLGEVFEFFAAARNLEELTPSWLKFEVVTPEPIDMHEGTLIDYRLKVHGLPIRWQSKITEWAPPHRFVDHQLKGPYRQWHHTHTFAEHEGGTLVRDEVDYAAPGGAFLGDIINRLMVERDVRSIFAYRSRKLAERFDVIHAPA